MPIFQCPPPIFSRQSCTYRTRAEVSLCTMCGSCVFPFIVQWNCPCKVCWPTTNWFSKPAPHCFWNFSAVGLVEPFVFLFCCFVSFVDSRFEISSTWFLHRIPMPRCWLLNCGHQFSSPQSWIHFLTVSKLSPSIFVLSFLLLLHIACLPGRSDSSHVELLSFLIREILFRSNFGWIESCLFSNKPIHVCRSIKVLSSLFPFIECTRVITFSQ